MYYELGKFYQNHKRYVRSQLAGTSSGSSRCAPQQYVGGQPNASLAHDGAINPCGLIAWSFFNDSFSAAIVTPDGAAMPLDSQAFDVSYPCKIPFAWHSTLKCAICAARHV